MENLEKKLFNQLNVNDNFDYDEYVDFIDNNSFVRNFSAEEYSV